MQKNQRSVRSNYGRVLGDPRLRRSSRTAKQLVALWVIWLLIILAFWGGLIYVAVHFISKWW